MFGYLADLYAVFIPFPPFLFPKDAPDIENRLTEHNRHMNDEKGSIQQIELAIPYTVTGCLAALPLLPSPLLLLA